MRDISSRHDAGARSDVTKARGRGLRPVGVGFDGSGRALGQVAAAHKHRVKASQLPSAKPLIARSSRRC